MAAPTWVERFAEKHGFTDDAVEAERRNVRACGKAVKELGALRTETLDLVNFVLDQLVCSDALTVYELHEKVQIELERRMS